MVIHFQNVYLKGFFADVKMNQKVSLTVLQCYCPFSFLHTSKKNRERKKERLVEKDFNS